MNVSVKATKRDANTNAGKGRESASCIELNQQQIVLCASMQSVWWRSIAQNIGQTTSAHTHTLPIAYATAWNWISLLLILVRHFILLSSVLTAFVAQKMTVSGNRRRRHHVYWIKRRRLRNCMYIKLFGNVWINKIISWKIYIYFLLVGRSVVSASALWLIVSFTKRKKKVFGHRFT